MFLKKLLKIYENKNTKAPQRGFCLTNFREKFLRDPSFGNFADTQR